MAASTIYDIASKAGVSYATVSRALNNRSDVNEHTRKNITRIAKKMGYRPSFAGKILASGKTHSVGLILPDLSNPFYLEFLRKLEGGCISKGYQLVTLEYALDSQRERGCLEEMLRRRCDAVVASVTRFDSVRDLLEEFWGKIPCFIHGLPLEDFIGQTKVDGTIVSLKDGYKASVDHLFELGHKKIGCVQSIPSEVGDSGRKSGLETEFSKFGIEYSDNSIFSRFSGNQMADGEAAMNDLIQKRPDITAIICTNDMVACGAIKAMTNLGLRCPQDISVIGADNTWLAEQWYVPLTSIDQNTKRCADIASETIFGRLENNNWECPMVVHSGSKLIVRNSTGSACR